MALGRSPESLVFLAAKYNEFKCMHHVFEIWLWKQDFPYIIQCKTSDPLGGATFEQKSII